MIKFDRDVHLTLKTLEKEGFETYAQGECVRELLRGAAAYDWDLVTKADAEDLKRLFPKGKIIDETRQVMRLDFTYEVEGKDDEPSRIEGVVLDVRHMDGSIEEEVSKMGYTIDALADNPERGFIDPFGGREDIKKKLISTISDADQLFKKEPIRMMEAVRLAAELGFDLHKGIYEAIVANWRLLLKYSVKEIREELERIMVSDNAGKGLNMLAGTGLLTAVLSEEVHSKMSASDMRALNTVCDKIDETKPVRMRRLGLLYTALSTKRGMKAVDYLNYDAKTRQYLMDALKEMISINFLGDDKAFKKFLFEHGLEEFNYLHNLSKAQRIVYDQPSNKIESRNYMLQKTIGSKEPVFVEDLVIDANDIMEAGIAQTQKKAEELLKLVVAVVHKNPKFNERNHLLKMAKKFSKSKFAVKTRYVTWIK